MVAAQSFWWRERLVTTLGARHDAIEFIDANEARIADANDPRITSKRFTLNEWDFNGANTTLHYRPTTFTAGAVLHATNRVSFFYNASKNNGTPRFDRTILPHGDIPPPTAGTGRDFGAMFDVFGDDRLFLRATWFETAQLHDAPINPGSNALGVDNLANMLGALQSAGKISQADYDRQAITYNSATIDIFTQGLELELVANPTKSLTLRLGYSYSERRREHFFTELFAFFEPRIAQWRELLKSNPTELATLNKEADLLWSEIGFQVDRQNSPFGTRPFKLNGTARYTVREGRLRGFFIGGAARYNGRNYMSIDRTTGRTYWGQASVFGDMFAGYRTRLPRTKTPLTLQLNVTNRFNISPRVAGERLLASQMGT